MRPGRARASVSKAWTSSTPTKTPTRPYRVPAIPTRTKFLVCPALIGARFDAHSSGGYKATLKNDNAGEGAKAHARDVLDQHGASYEPMATRKENPDPERVASGYNATMKSMSCIVPLIQQLKRLDPNTSEDAKRNAQQYLEENDD